ncbi:MAG: hypothetical protein HXX15_21215 [Rhodopseudomonas sp.]|uniref:hypothetical protein n=1 Tax=Rhodopseudomonas sp. TaxID=1078 RepID=UPI0017B566DD|nr:hypothetical protein [Rhodopseudomonas sp.]NVN88607.1 hypothetical protein [Rhodopseudomonas sp.]
MSSRCDAGRDCRSQPAPSRCWAQEVGKAWAVNPLWDFASPAWLSDDTRYWLDDSHFTSEIGAMMIGRMFGTGAAVPADFGRYRPLAVD